MTVMCGGEEKLYEKCLPIMKCYCRTHQFMGKVGTATITKIISNQLCAVHTVITGEALMMAKKAGIDLKSFF